ncbi:tetratricopeptide repeat protein, partial [Streptomyces sp. NPDC006129]
RRRAGRRVLSVRDAVALVEDSERVRGPRHPDTLGCRNLLGHACWEAGDPHRAAAVFEELWKQCEEVLPEEHETTFWVRGNLAWLTADTGPADDAVRWARNLVDDATELFGPDHRRTLEVLPVLAHALAQADEPEQALEVLRDLLRRTARLLDQPEYPETVDDVVRVHQQAAARDGEPTPAGRPAETEDEDGILLGVLVEMFATRFGGFLPTLATQLAHAVGDAGDPADAVAVLKAVHAGRARMFGPDHPNTLESLAELAFACLEADDPDSAPSHEELLAGWERTFGPDHPETAELRWRLRTARPAWRARLTLVTDDVTAGRPVTIEVRLEREERAAATAPPRLMVAVSCPTAAAVDPATAEYDPGGAPTRFTLTASEPGAHDVRFTLYDHASGFVLQELKTVVHVQGAREG